MRGMGQNVHLVPAQLLAELSSLFYTTLWSFQVVDTSRNDTDNQVQNESFLSERKDDPRIKSREKSLQEFDQAYWKWREIVDNAEEGIKFYQSFGEMLGGFKGGCIQFLNSRRVDVGYVFLFPPPPHPLLSSSFRLLLPKA